MAYRTLLPPEMVSRQEKEEEVKYTVGELRAAAEQFYAERSSLRASTLITDRNKLNLFFEFLATKESLARHPSTGIYEEGRDDVP